MFFRAMKLTTANRNYQLEELGELEPAILENQAKLDACDIICYTYDSSDPNSFSHVVELRVIIPISG